MGDDSADPYQDDCVYIFSRCMIEEDWDYDQLGAILDKLRTN